MMPSAFYNGLVKSLNKMEQGSLSLCIDTFYVYRMCVYLNVCVLLQVSCSPMPKAQRYLKKISVEKYHKSIDYSATSIT